MFLFYFIVQHLITIHECIGSYYSLSFFLSVRRYVDIYILSCFRYVIALLWWLLAQHHFHFVRSLVSTYTILVRKYLFKYNKKFAVCFSSLRITDISENWINILDKQIAQLYTSIFIGTLIRRKLRLSNRIVWERNYRVLQRLE